MSSITINIVETSAAFVPGALEWLKRFHHDVEIERSSSEVSLQSTSHDEQQLTRMWRSALLNEQLEAAAHDGRRSTLDTLLR